MPFQTTIADAGAEQVEQENVLADEGIANKDWIGDRITAVEKFRERDGGGPDITVQQAFDVVFTAEEKTEYSIDNFISDLRGLRRLSSGSDSDLSFDTTISASEIRQFLET